MSEKKPRTAKLLTALFLAAAAPASLSAGCADDLFNGPFSGLAPVLAHTVPAPPAAEAPQAGVFDAPQGKIYYLAPWQVELDSVPPAPAAGSAADRADLAEVKRWQEERTPAQCAAANAQPDATYDNFFGAISPFGENAPKEVEKIFFKVRADTASMVFLLKRKYERPRPFLRDPALVPCLDREGGYAYPSGHSAVARVFGLMLSELVPANALKYMSYADQAALNRVIGGVHHPSDTAAGKKLGDVVYKALSLDRAFKADMDILRRNLKP